MSEYKSIKVPMEVYERIKAEAARRGCFIGHLITQALAAFLKRKP